MELIKACPFCKDEKAPQVMSAWEMNPTVDPETVDNNFTVCCAVNEQGCGASSGYAQTPAQAISKWNRRGDE